MPSLLLLSDLPPLIKFRVCRQTFETIKVITFPSLAGRFSYLNFSPDTFNRNMKNKCQSQWQRGLRRRSAAERLLGPWVRIPPGAWMFVSCECLCCQVEVSATGRSLVQRSPTDCGVWVWSSGNKHPRHLLWTSAKKREGLRNEKNEKYSRTRL
jgi:hypothetical protein